MLDERKANILRAVVEEYIDTAQPVGSGHVASAPGVNVSSATVRNDMAVLEQEGYLAQPHTSAGRVPTEKGYRFFVDTLASPAALAAGDASQVRAFFAKAHGEIEGMLADTSRLLGELTRYAAVVVGPPHEVARVRSVQVVDLAPHVVLLVVVLSNGAIEKHTLDLGEGAEIGPDELQEASAVLQEHLVGWSLSRAAEPVDGPEPTPLVAAALRALAGDHGHEADQVYIGGTSGMVAAFDAVATVSEVLRILEQQLVVVSLLKDVVDRGQSVAIGTETGIEPLADCAVVVSPYSVGGEQAGAIGVLGPTRMNYPQALAAVAVVSQRLGRRLTEG